VRTTRVATTRFAIIHTPGFLSLVIPDLALGDIGVDRAFLAERGHDGRWHEVSIAARLTVVE